MIAVEVGAGERPHPAYGLHTDVLPLPGIAVVCLADRLPFADGSVGSLRANHVLEHQSWELVEATVREWRRVLAPGGRLYIGVPDARLIARQWVTGEIATLEANYWMLGGHSDRAAHKGVDGRGVPRWIWNAHHALFDEPWLRQLLESCGMVDVVVTPDGRRNLCCTCRRPAVCGGVS